MLENLEKSLKQINEIEKKKVTKQADRFLLGLASKMKGQVQSIQTDAEFFNNQNKFGVRF